MVKTRFTELVSVRIDSYLLKTMKEDVQRKKEKGIKRASISSLINDIILNHYFSE